MANEQPTLTAEGRKRIEEELHYLETVRRAEIGERIRIAREFGDISENSEYDDAKNEQGMNEARIAELMRTLSEATVAKTSKRSTKVNIGTKVTVVMNGHERLFTIVGAAESDVDEGRISNESPVGKALIGHKKGDKIVAYGPTGREINLEILKLEQ